MTSSLRVASFLPAATEIVCALEMGSSLVLRSHECDHPPWVTALPAATGSKLDADGRSYGIHERVRGLLQEGLSVYRVHGELLQELRPHVLVTQEHCEACAVGPEQVVDAVRSFLDDSVTVVSLEGETLEGVEEDFRKVARALDMEADGHELVAQFRARLARVGRRSLGESRPRVAVLEWMEPLMGAGNWVPELVSLAGGTPVFGEPGMHSPWLEEGRLEAEDPEVLVLAPCGYTVERTLGGLTTITARPEWGRLSAVRERRVYVADGHHYFNRPGPRLADSAEVLAEILHSGRDQGDPGPSGPMWVRVDGEVG